MFFNLRKSLLAALVAFMAVGLAQCDRFGGSDDPPEDKDTVREESTDTLAGDTAAEQDYYSSDTITNTAVDSPDVETDDGSYYQETQNGTETSKWNIVISSQPSRERAESFASKHNVDAEIRYVDRLDTYRVVHSSFYQLNLAQDEFDRIQGHFPDAWLVKF